MTVHTLGMLCSWRGFVLGLVIFGFLPKAFLRLIVRAWPKDDEVRKEVLANLDHQPYWYRPLYVAAQVENALFDGLGARLRHRQKTPLRAAFWDTFTGARGGTTLGEWIAIGMAWLLTPIPLLWLAHPHFWPTLIIYLLVTPSLLGLTSERMGFIAFIAVLVLTPAAGLVVVIGGPGFSLGTSVLFGDAAAAALYPIMMIALFAFYIPLTYWEDHQRLRPKSPR